MDKRDVMNALFDQGLVPVVRVGSAEEALGAAKALMEGGVRLLEITMSVPGALKLIEELSGKSDPGFIFGAGTVLDSETGRAAILSGGAIHRKPFGERGPDPALLPLRGARFAGSHDAYGDRQCVGSRGGRGQGLSRDANRRSCLHQGDPGAASAYSSCAHGRRQPAERGGFHPGRSSGSGRGRRTGRLQGDQGGQFRPDYSEDERIPGCHRKGAAGVDGPYPIAE